MYKTVRHGENSLQYTILPQTEEVLNNSGLKGKGRDYSPSIHVRRSRRRSTVKYVLLIMFGVIIALALAAVPLYVMNGALFSRRILADHHEVVTSAPFSPTSSEIARSQKIDLRILPEIMSTAEIKPDISTSTVALTTLSTISSIATGEKATTPPWTMPALRSWKSSTVSTTVKPIPTQETTELHPIETLSSNDHMTIQDTSIKPWEKDIIIRPTATPEPTSLRTVIKYYSQSYAPTEKSTTTDNKIFDDVLISSRGSPTRSPVTKELTTSSDDSKLRDLKDAVLEDEEEFKESLGEDEVFSSKEGPLKSDLASISTENDEVTVSKTGDSGWYGARWPFVDTLSHFQWTDYSPGDNLLLPLLIAALSSVALVLLLALAVRRRKRTHCATAKIGVTADVNTKLLTAENPEEGEE
ncbi:hypothetical protein K1T71_008283 [Dendrolimus kikuchii]|uniref:Uncharacterized protein n=1 Tax=Dendrolimus kikuchii TaxID=765133 RepID=A0ACC1CX84_9NEOP|nr:hypothetical protein K1T71_008283 [Dendrolimus kikuchii]